MRRDAREASPLREGLEPLVDAVGAERDHAGGAGRPDGGPEFLERPGKRPHEQPEVLVLGRRVGLRRPDADAELAVALGRLDVGPDERRGLGAPQPPAEQQRHHHGVDERPPGGRRLGLEPAAAAATIAGGEHQLARVVVGEGARLARRRPRLPGVLAGDAAERVGDDRRLRRIRTAGRAAGGGDRGRRAPDRGQLRPLGAPGEVGGDLRRPGLEGRGRPRRAPALEPAPLRGVGPARRRRPGGGRGRGDAGPFVGLEAGEIVGVHRRERFTEQVGRPGVRPLQCAIDGRAPRPPFGGVRRGMPQPYQRGQVSRSLRHRRRVRSSRGLRRLEIRPFRRGSSAPIASTAAR